MQSGTHPSEKQFAAELFRNDSVSDNDTPVLPKGGRPTEILPGVRVPWSGSQPPSQVFALASGEVVSNTDAKRDLYRVSMSEATGIAAVSVGGAGVAPLRLTS